MDRFAVSVDRPVQVVWLAPNRHGSFVHSPGAPNRSGESSPSLLIFGDIPQYPAHDRCVRYGDAALGYHGGEIAIAEAVRDVPPNAQLDDIGRETATTIDGVARRGTGHPRPLLQEV